MRLCIFTTDLGSIASRKELLRQRVFDLTGADTFNDVSFVGCRQRQAVEDGLSAHQPYVYDTARMRVANLAFRLVDAIPLMPSSVAGMGVTLSAPMIVETILACDPDAVLLDVRWGHSLRRALAKDFPGPIYVPGDVQRTGVGPSRPWRNCDAAKRVSIILPTHNGSRHIRQSIQSCLDQTFRSFELIVVDDGSAEDMCAIVSEFSDPRIRYVRHEKNRGISAALNTGFGLASGDYLTWTSDDNYYAPDAIDRLVRFLQSYPAIDFVYASAYILDEMGLGKTMRVLAPQPVEYLKRHNGVGACFLYTRRVYQEIGDYNSAAFLVEDYDYWVRVSQKFRMQRIFAPLYYYRYHKDSLTFQHSREEVAARLATVQQRNGIA